MIRRIFKLKILQNTLIFSGSIIINRAIPFLLAPIITLYLAPADYGMVANFISLLGVLLVFSGVNTNAILDVKFFNVDRNHLKLLVGNILIILLIFSSLSLCVIWIFSSWFSATFELPFPWILTGLFCAVASFINIINLGLWQLEKKARNYATFTIVETILNVSLSLFFIIVLKMTWEGRLLGIAISVLLFGLLGLLMIIYRGYLTFRFDKKIFKEALSFGFPLIPHNLGGWMRTGASIIIITYLLGSEYAGIFNLGSQFAMIVYFFGNGFTMALTPVIYEKLANPSPASDLKLVKINYLYFIGILLLALFVSLVAPFAIRTFFNESYHDSIHFIPWLCFSFAFFSMYFAVLTYLLHYKKMVWLSIISTISGLLNIGLCFSLVEITGVLGAAIASFFSFFFMFMVVLLYAQKLHPLPWFNFKAILKP